MAASTYGRKLDPYRRLKSPLGIKGMRQSVVVTNNPSTIDQNQQLLVRFPNLGAHDVIVPGTARLALHNLPDLHRRQPNGGPEPRPCCGKEEHAQDQRQ